MSAISKIFSVSLDMKAPTAQRNEWEVVEGDNGNIIEITLTDDGVPVDLTGCKVLAVFGLPTGVTVEQDTDEGSVTIGGTDNNVITIALKTGSFSPGKSSSGLMKCEIQVYSGVPQNTLITSAQFTFRCRRAIMNDDTIAATDEYPVLVELIEEVQHLIIDNQSDWAEADPTDPAYIKNKPTSMTPTAHAATHKIGGTDALPAASTSASGLVQLYDGIDSTATNKAATANSAKKAYDDAIKLPCNPNILDNWFFDNPINQRGQNSYTGTGYGIDRWNIYASSMGMTNATGHYLILSPNSNISANTRLCYQKIENPSLYSGKTLTVSIMTSDSCEVPFFVNIRYVVDGSPTSVGLQIPANDSKKVYSKTCTLPSGVTDLMVNFQATGDGIASGKKIRLLAAKLEIGSLQTLAYHDGTGWQLREIPNYAEQMLRCQRFQYVLSGAAWTTLAPGFCANSTTVRCQVPLPVPMAKTTGTASVIGGSVSNAVIYTNRNAVTPTAVVSTVYGTSKGNADVEFTVTSVTQFDPATLSTSSADLKILIDCNL